MHSRTSYSVFDTPAFTRLRVRIAGPFSLYTHEALAYNKSYKLSQDKSNFRNFLSIGYGNEQTKLMPVSS